MTCILPSTCPTNCYFIVIFLLSFLLQISSYLVVSKPGQEPSISYGIDTLEENMNILDPIFSKMSHRKRKAYFVKRFVIIFNIALPLIDVI